ncbi:hypothetical protein pb186bvf_010132 [Paramecium bursaria]
MIKEYLFLPSEFTKVQLNNNLDISMMRTSRLRSQSNGFYWDKKQRRDSNTQFGLQSTSHRSHSQHKNQLIKIKVTNLLSYYPKIQIRKK